MYVHNRPVRGVGEYHGRTAEVRALASGIVQGRSFVVCGGPRTGRTSTLAYVAELLRLRWKREPGEVKVVPVVVDLQEALNGRGAGRVQRRIWEVLVGAVLNAEVSGKAQPVRAPEPNFLRAKDPWAALRVACEELWGRLSGSGGWCRYALILDQADLLATPKLDEAVQPLLELANAKTPWAPASLVLGAGRLLHEQTFDHRSPLHALRPVLLGLFRDDEAAMLCRLGFPEAEEQWARNIVTATGKHPYLMQRVLAEFEVRGASVPLAEILAAVEVDTRALFDDIWRAFDLERGVTYRGAYAAPEHALMQFLLDAGKEVTLALAEKELGIKSLREYAQFLEYVGVAEPALRGDRTVYRAPCDLWNVWYSQRILQ